MGYLRRFAAYSLARVSGRESEAYAELRELYLEGEGQRVPTLLSLLGQLEEKLSVPQSQRVYIGKTAADAGDPPVVR
jgi:hypothetical protein